MLSRKAIKVRRTESETRDFIGKEVGLSGLDTLAANGWQSFEHAQLSFVPSGLSLSVGEMRTF
jgi:hypothetical protein